MKRVVDDDVEEQRERKKARLEEAAEYQSPGCSISTKVRIPSSLLRSGVEGSSIRGAVQQDIKSGNPKLRMSALRFLANKDPQVVDDILYDCSLDPRACVRQAVLDAALVLKSNRHQRVALLLLKDTSLTVRTRAIQLLRMLGKELEQTDYTYLQLCTILTDMSSVQAREEACFALGSLRSVSENVILHSLNKRSQIPAGEVLTGNDPVDVGMKDQNLKTVIASSAGALVHALEDELYEVRSAAIQTLVNLSKLSKKVGGIASQFLFDMMNDQNVGVRKSATQGLLQTVGWLSLRDEHLQVLFGVLEDSNKELRSDVWKLISSIQVPTTSLFRTLVQKVMNAAARRREDRKELLSAVESIGNLHISHVEAIMPELIEQMTALADEEGDLVPLLILCRAAVNFNKNILLPPRFMAHAAFVKHDTSLAGPDIGPVRDIMQRALAAKPLEKENDKLTILSDCRRQLRSLKSSSLADLAILYVEVLFLLAELSSVQQHTYRQTLLEKLGFVLGHIQRRFSGFTPVAALQLLELQAFYLVAGGKSLSDIISKWRDMSIPSSFILKLEGSEDLSASIATFWPEHNIVEEGIRKTWAELHQFVPGSDNGAPILFIPGLPLRLKLSGVLHNHLDEQRIWVRVVYQKSSIPEELRFLSLKKCGSFEQEVELFNASAASRCILLQVCLVLCVREEEEHHRRGPSSGHYVQISSHQLVYVANAFI